MSSLTAGDWIAIAIACACGLYLAVSSLRTVRRILRGPASGPTCGGCGSGCEKGAAPLEATRSGARPVEFLGVVRRGGEASGPGERAPELRATA
ncbi:MAG TPA: hypothetical protein VMT52_04325, partial [Planctomycetota bacterium]|nr:hypothetical protein [Planctomycetota bacterium]